MLVNSKQKKNPEILIEAVQNLSEKYHLVITGTGPQQKYLKDKTSGNQQVHFLGFKNQSAMPTIYRMADVLCLPSTGPNETWGLSVNEALACGIPVVVSTKAGCSKDVLIDESMGTAIEPTDLEAFITAIKRYTQTRPNPQAMREFTTRFCYKALINKIKLQCHSIATKPSQLSSEL